MQKPDLPPPAPATAGRQEAMAVAYVPHRGLLRLSFANFLLNVLTLSIYRFWAKTRVRRHIWGSIHINGEPLEYTGTGFELFLGALVVFGLIGLPFIVTYTTLFLVHGPEHWSLIALQGALTLLILVLYGMAVYRARRYRLSRTLWRGIRGALVGSPLAYSAKTFGSILLKVVTLGWATPAMNLMLQNQIINEMRFGDQPFRFSGAAGPLYRRYAVCWLLTVVVILPIIIGLIFSTIMGSYGSFDDLLRRLNDPAQDVETVGYLVGVGLVAFLLFMVLSTVIWATYIAREMNLFTGYTGYGGVQFALAATTPSLIALWLGNLAIVIFTLGILQPYATQRSLRYFCDRLRPSGTVDLAAVRQSQAALDKRGEGLVDAFDIDAI